MGPFGEHMNWAKENAKIWNALQIRIKENSKKELEENENKIKQPFWTD